MEQLTETPLGILPRSKAWDSLKAAGIDPANNVRILEASIEVWEKNPEKPGYLRFVRRRKPNEIWELVKALLPHYIPQWEEYFDYIGISSEFKYQKTEDEDLPKFRHIACYVVKGGSEGHYLHVDLLMDEGKRQQLFLGKTLSWSAQTAWETAQAMALILEE